MIRDYFEDEHKVLFPEKVPEFCKEAELIEPNDPIGYADVANKRYPINTPTNVWMSMEYFEKVAHEFDDDYRTKVASKLNDAAKIYYINRRIDMEKMASDKSEGIDKIAELETELAKFENGWMNIPWEKRREYAQELEKAAGLLNIEIGDLSPMVEQYASQNVTDGLDSAILERIAVSGDDPEVNEKGMTLLGLKKKLNADNLIIALSLLDKEHGLDKLYDKEIPDPVLSVTSGKHIVNIPDKLPERVIESLSDSIDRDILTMPISDMPEHVKEVIKNKHGIALKR